MWSSITSAFSARIEKLRNSYIKRTQIKKLLASVKTDALILEIGGGFNPRFFKATYPNVRHLDHCSTEELRKKYSDPSLGVAHRASNIQEVDFVFSGGPIEDLVPPDMRFDLIYGSHVLEHQVDLITHLQSLEKLIAVDGRIIEVIPDLRACFDALRFPTVTSDVLVVHLNKPTIHQGKQVFDYLARMVNADRGYRMSEGDFDGLRFEHSLAEAQEKMLAMEERGATYFDSHAWAFTPTSFQLLMLELRLLGLTNLSPSYVSPQYGNQFCVELARVPAVDTLSPQAIGTLNAQRFTLSRQMRIR